MHYGGSFDLFPSLSVIILAEQHNVQLHNLSNKQNIVWKDIVHNEEFGAASGGNLGLCGWTGSSIMVLKGSAAVSLFMLDGSRH